MLSKEPVRIQRDWEVGIMARCDFCDRWDMTVPHADGGRICAPCCDSETLSSWQDYAREVATELLALREQLEALKSLPSFAYAFHRDTGVMWFAKDKPMCSEFDVIPLFTAAKPEALPRHIFSMLVNELRDVPAIGCKRELIVGVLNRHGVIAEPVQLAPPATE
jgi:hypothetical protein